MCSSSKNAIWPLYIENAVTTVEPERGSLTELLKNSKMLFMVQDMGVMPSVSHNSEKILVIVHTTVIQIEHGHSQECA